jgi:hypothetical protein
MTNKGVNKTQIGVSFDTTVVNAFPQQPYFNRSAWINNIVKEHLRENGMLKVE